jgi:hypothetical protein
VALTKSPAVLVQICQVRIAHKEAKLAKERAVTVAAKAVKEKAKATVVVEKAVAIAMVALARLKAAITLILVGHPEQIGAVGKGAKAAEVLREERVLLIKLTAMEALVTIAAAAAALAAAIVVLAAATIQVMQ